MRKLYTYVKTDRVNHQYDRAVRRIVFTFKRVKSHMALRIMSLKQRLAWHKWVPLRQRYIFAKSGGVRMRYRCATAICALSLLAAPLASMFSSYGPYEDVPLSPSVGEIASLEPAAGEETPAALASVLSNDCLLYTSPSPRDLSTSRMPSSA